MLNLPLPSEDNRSSWQKPGSNLAKIITGGLILGIGFAFVKYLPFLVSLTQNFFTLVVMVIATIALIAVVTNKKFINLVSTSFFLICRYLTNLVVEIDPIAIVEREVEEMKDRQKEVSILIGKIHGLNLKNKQEIEEKKAEALHQINLAQQAADQGDRAQEGLHARQATRLKDSISRRFARLQQSVKWEKILRQLKKAADITIEDTENEVNERKEEYKAVQEQFKAFSSIMSILNGESDTMDQFCHAMDFMANDISLKVGQMDSVINETGGLLTQISLENGVASKQARELLDRYEKEGFENLFPSFESIDLSGLSEDFEEMKDLELLEEFKDEPQPVLIKKTRRSSGNKKTLDNDSSWF